MIVYIERKSKICKEVEKAKVPEKETLSYYQQRQLKRVKSETLVKNKQENSNLQMNYGYRI